MRLSNQTPIDEGRQCAREMRDRGLDLNDAYTKRLAGQWCKAILATTTDREEFWEGYNEVANQ